MEWLKSRSMLWLSLCWVVGLFLVGIYGQRYWIEDADHLDPNQSSEIIIPRGLYQESFEVAFEGETRDLWQKPDQVIESLGDLEGLQIADIGCGEGYFTIRLAREVGPSGVIYASDIQKEVLQRMQESIPEEFSGRVIPILATEDGLGIPQPVDLVFLVQVLGEVPNQRAFLKKILKIMKPQARLVLIDSKHITDPTSGYSRPQNLSRLLDELKEEGLVLAEPPLHFLPKQFFFILKKKQAPETN